MSRRNPFEELEQFFDRMSRQVDTGELGTLATSSMATDVLDTDDSIEVVMDLPGFERDAIDITLSGDTLRVEAERTLTDVEERGQYVRQERSDRSVSRSIHLPDPVSDGDAKAAYEDGILRIELPKVDPTESGHQIDID